MRRNNSSHFYAAFCFNYLGFCGALSVTLPAGCYRRATLCWYFHPIIGSFCRVLQPIIFWMRAIISARSELMQREQFYIIKMVLTIKTLNEIITVRLQIQALRDYT